MKREKNKKYTVDLEAVTSLLAILQKQKFITIGPTIRDDSIILDELESISDLPQGMTDIQEAGTYRLKKRKDKALFGYNVGPFSAKKYLFPPQLTLVKSKRVADKIVILHDNESVDKIALFGITPCELEAILIQDKIFIKGEYVDSYYKKQREKLFIVTANCTEAGKCCFCTSMQTGPEATRGFDLALTELIDNDKHTFLIEAGTAAGLKVLSELKTNEPDKVELDTAERKISAAKKNMGRSLKTDKIEELLLENLNHPYWDEVAERCLSCGNCTLVCPTCFCSDVQDVTSLSGEENERIRIWDSCFSKEYSYIHGGAVRASIKSRYRQWLTHKLASWKEQFGTSGCVGCGRCIVWCPVGIDITEEVRTMQEKVTAHAG